jgi:broad specificity phosphatase PhoE
MGWPKLLVLVRHAESEGNVRTVEEKTAFDVATYAYDLTERGRQQALITGHYLKERFGSFDTYYTSYYRRAVSTMNLMFPEAKIYEDPRLAEAQFGIWHIMTRAQIEVQFPAELARREREGLYHYRPWGGENWPDIELRIHSFLGTLSRDYEDQKVLAVVHGHWTVLFQRLIHHYSIEETIRKYESGIFENTSVTIYEGSTIDGKSRLLLKEENFVPWLGQL